MKNVKFTLLSVIVLILTGFKSFGQIPNTNNGQACTPTADGCNVPIVTDIGNIYGCPGSSYTFTPTFTTPGLTLNSWRLVTGTTTLSSGTGSTVPATTVTVPAGACNTYSLTVSATGPQLIESGDFPWPYACDNTPDCFRSTYGNGCGSSGWDGGHVKITDASGMNAPCVTSGTIPDWGTHTVDRTAALFVNGGSPVFAGVEYFWGQEVNLCDSATYIFTYWVRLWNNVAVKDSNTLPYIETLVGSAGGHGTLEGGYYSAWYDNTDPNPNPYGYAYPYPPYVLGFGASYLGSCSSSWQQVTQYISYIGSSGTQFICLNLRNSPAVIGMYGEFAVDDISLVRIKTVTEPVVTICPSPPPTVTITPSATAACVGSAFTFTVTGTAGETVYYNRTAPGCATVYGSSVIPFTVTVPATCIATTGLVCLNVTSITATTATGPCTYPVTDSKCVPVLDNVITGTITPATACIPPATTFSVTTTTTGGTSYSWSCSPPGTISGSATGAIANISASVAGVITVTCVVTSPCASGVITGTVTVSMAPVPIAGPVKVCVGSTIALTDYTAGGTWSSSNNADATVSSTGMVTGVSAGTVTIDYMLPDGCPATYTVAVNPLPAAITGQSTVCSGSTFMVSDAISGGTWSSSNNAIATIALAGHTVTGVYPGGVVNIIYTLPTGCEAMETVTVNPVPTITGPFEVCSGSAITLSDLPPGGTWSSSNVTIASVVTVTPGTGTVTGGATTGVVTITYTNATTGCASEHTVTVVTIPAKPVITGPLIVYQGCTITLHGSPATGGSITGAAWGTIAGGTGSVTLPAFSGAGMTSVTGATVGTAIVTYEVENICGWSAAATYTVTVIPKPVIKCEPTRIVCAGTTFVCGAAPAGGVWTSGTISVATAGPTTGGAATIYAVSAGTSILTYSLPLAAGGCVAIGTTTLTVLVAPTPITGDLSICTLGGTTQLSDGVAGGVWTSSNTSVATIDPGSGLVTDVSVSGSSVITYQLSDGCEVSATVTMLAGAPACVCSYPQAALFTELEPLHTGTLTTSPTTGGYYFLNHSIVINSNISMLNCVVVIAQGVSITVNSGAELTLTGSHLFCCYPNMWQGITLSTNIPGGGTGGPTGQLVLKSNPNGGSTMIEDAVIAVAIPSPIYESGYVTAGSATNLLTLYSNGAIFNKDSIGVGIDYSNVSYPLVGDPTGLHPSYPYVIENTVFTCRDFYGYAIGTNTWPFVWPVTNGAPLLNPTQNVGGLKSAITYTGSPYTPPYNIEAYTGTTCNNGVLGYCGIGLYSVGITITTATAPAGTYSGVAVGGAEVTASVANDMNLFDTLNYGIYAINSNVASRNSAYMHMYGAKSTGQGIHSGRSIAAAAMGNLYALDVYGVAGFSGYINQFWDCATDVFANDLYYVRGIYSRMSSAHSSAALTNQQGLYGYQVTVSDYYNVELNYNTIYNIRTGIHSYLVSPPAGAVQYVGQMSVNHNIITPHAGGGHFTPYHEYIHVGIDVEATTYPSQGSYYVPGSEINTDSNGIDYTYNGIMLIGFDKDFQAKTSIGNTVIIVPDITAAAATAYEQACIWHANNTLDYIENNSTNGLGYNVPTPPTPTYLPAMTPTYTVTEGIHCGNDNTVTVCGNYTSDMNTGFFFGGIGQAYWSNNTMINHAFGYILDGGPIGAQPYPLWGYPSLPGSLSFVTGNQWQAFPTYGFTGWTGANYQTYTINVPVPADLTTTIGSAMEVANTTAQVPTNNFAQLPALPANKYSTVGPNGIYAVSPDTVTWPCTPPPGTTVPSVYRVAAQEQLPYTPGFVNNTNWIGQMYTWRMIGADTTVDTSAVLYSFKQMALNSRYKNLCDIEQNIATGNYTAASALLSNPLNYMASGDSDALTGAVMADSAGNNVVANYRAYYQLLVKYQMDTLSSSDSVTVAVLANMCPFADGAIIYNARALYNIVFNDSRVFSDVGCGSSSGGSDGRVRNTGDSTSGNTVVQQVHDDNSLNGAQNYTLSPNPSTGIIMLKQGIVDNNPVSAEIWNSTGMNVYKGQFYFQAGTTQFDMSDKTPGLYLLQLTDSGGNHFMLKFVINGK